MLCFTLFVLLGSVWNACLASSDSTSMIENRMLELEKRLTDLAENFGANIQKRSTNSDEHCFTIPSGPAGPQGIPGEAGPQGEAGPPGAPGADGQPATSSGAVYTRWGRTTCPSGSSLLYAGFAAGTLYTTKGGSSRYQCMPEIDQWEFLYNGTITADYSLLTGSEYQVQTTAMFGGSIPNRWTINVPCARCYTNARSALLTIPAKIRCPAGWRVEYQGYLMAERTDSRSSYRTSYECVDKDPEPLNRLTENNNGALFYPTVPACSGTGRIGDCPNEVSGKPITCVVCSK